MSSDDSKIQPLQGAIEDAERAMQLAIDLGLYARLNAEQIRAIREPWSVLGGARRREYPLNTGEVARITGTSAKQIRTWEASSLVPAYRIAGRRRFFSAALVYAFLLKDLDRNDIRCLAAHTHRRPRRPVTRDRRLRDHPRSTQRPSRTPGHAARSSD